MSWPKDMDMLWIKFLSFVSVFCSAKLSCSMIVHVDKRSRGHKFSEFACFDLDVKHPTQRNPYRLWLINEKAI